MAIDESGMVEFVDAVLDEIRKRRRTPHSERRDWERYHLLRETPVAVLHSLRADRKAGERFSATIHNISRAGIGFVCHERFVPGDVVGLELAVPTKTRWVWADVKRCDGHSAFVGSTMRRLNDIGAEFCAAYRKHFAAGLRGGDRDERARMLQLLIRSREPWAEDELLGLLSPDDDEVCCEAVIGLGQLGTSEAVKSLLVLLSSPDVLAISANHPLNGTLREAGLLRGEQDVAHLRRAEQNGTPARPAAAKQDLVSLAELSAHALRLITKLDLSFDAGAADDERSNQRQRCVDQARAWLDGRA